MNLSIQLTKYKNQIINPYMGKISYLQEENINQILWLHQILREALKDDTLFYFDNYDLYKYQLERDAKIFGCYIGNEPICYSVMIFSGYDDENLGYD